MGVVFVVLIFITLVIYGMWVAAGVVAEKSSRVMELLISAASPGELVTGKVDRHRPGRLRAVRGHPRAGPRDAAAAGPDRDRAARLV